LTYRDAILIFLSRVIGTGYLFFPVRLGKPYIMSTAILLFLLNGIQVGYSCFLTFNLKKDCKYYK
jgi:hypothetical protein